LKYENGVERGAAEKPSKLSRLCSLVLVNVGKAQGSEEGKALEVDCVMGRGKKFWRVFAVYGQNFYINIREGLHQEKFLIDSVESYMERGLRYEKSSSVRTLGSRVRIPLMAWMSVYIYSVFVLPCIVSGVSTGLSLVRGVLPTALGLRN
jgi:hypothetical protein